MGKLVPIDDLFREKLSGGEEQLNLGAWANMERMLDGKNPYAEEETKRKRRILPFILFFTLLSGLVTAGYIALKPSKSDSNDHVLSSNIPEKSSSNTQVALNNTTNENEQQPVTASTTQTNAMKQEHNVATTSFKASKQQHSIGTKSHNTKSTPEITNSNPLEKNKQHKTGDDNINSNNNDQNPIAIASNTSNADLKKEKKNKPKHSETLKNNSKETQSSESIAKTATTPKDENLTPSNFSTESTTEKNNIHQVKINEKINRKRDGSILLDYDTISNTVSTIENEKSSFVATRTIPTENTNPRYVELTPEQEQMMNSQAPIIASATPQVNNATKINPETTPISTPSLTNAKKAKPEKEGFFDQLRTFYQKIAVIGASILNVRGSYYPGISVGVNTAMFNPNNNFGGFHIGVTNLKPVGNHFSILTELKLFVRNNSGYTVQDISTLNKNLSTDNVTLANQNKSIYTYQVDSTVNSYNFKGFTTIELPVMFQAHIRSFTAYGGVNIAYGFKLNTKEIKRNYIVEKKETLDNSILFQPQAELGNKYSRDDFSSRFGLGYTIGAAYNFNQNVYVDLRVTKNVWDDAKTLSAKEVSSNYFKVPTLQLSLGYRFKKFSTDN
jgi:hypothetical protein